MKLFRIVYYFILSKYLINKFAYKRKKFEDRDVLERIIFPYILSHLNPKTILDVGREDYQKFYNKFFTSRELWTIDIDPEAKEFGAKNHIVDNITNIKKYFKENYHDFVMINGVCGWGLDKKEDMEKVFSDIYDLMKPNGILVIGWNDFEDIETVSPESINTIKKFKPFYFKPLKTDCFKCINGEHVYNFYQK